MRWKVDKGKPLAVWQYVYDAMYAGREISGQTSSFKETVSPKDRPKGPPGSVMFLE